MCVCVYLITHASMYGTLLRGKNQILFPARTHTHTLYVCGRVPNTCLCVSFSSPYYILIEPNEGKSVRNFFVLFVWCVFFCRSCSIRGRVYACLGVCMFVCVKYVDRIYNIFTNYCVNISSAAAFLCIHMGVSAAPRTNGNPAEHTVFLLSCCVCVCRCVSVIRPSLVHVCTFAPCASVQTHAQQPLACTYTVTVCVVSVRSVAVVRSQRAPMCIYNVGATVRLHCAKAQDRAYSGYGSALHSHILWRIRSAAHGTVYACTVRGAHTAQQSILICTVATRTRSYSLAHARPPATATAKACATEREQPSVVRVAQSSGVRVMNATKVENIQCCDSGRTFSSG